SQWNGSSWSEALDVQGRPSSGRNRLIRFSRELRTASVARTRRIKMAAQHPIRFGIQTGQQNATWEELCQVWEKSDAWGYDSLWVFDHFYPIFVPDPTGPCMEGWTLLSALSQRTKRARIGALVNGNTYRNPCLTAKMAATLDVISGGR